MVITKKGSVGPKSFIQKALDDISNTTATKQLVIGAASGWMIGYLVMKIGKTAACAVGGGIIILEIASQKGCIHIDWDKVNKQCDKVVDEVEEQIARRRLSWLDKFCVFASSNRSFSAGFIGGFFIGLACN